MHIGSTVTGTIREDKDAVDAVDAILPAGTLSGAPKFRACQIIDQLENNKRGVYGGAIGYLDFAGNLDTCIAIRLVYKKERDDLHPVRCGDRSRQRTGKRIRRMCQQGQGCDPGHPGSRGGIKMILLIDNYDSFSYNLYQLIGSVEPDIKVIRNDAHTIEEIEAMKPEAIILSPGPGKPEDAGVCIEAIKYFTGKLPILRRVSGTSGDLRGIRRYGFLCKGADARQAEQGVSGRHQFVVPRSGTGIQGSSLPLAGGARGEISRKH